MFQGKFVAIAEGLTSYVVAGFILGFGALVDHAPVVMSLGGIGLLGLRLYVDTLNARRAYRSYKREAEYDAERGK